MPMLSAAVVCLALNIYHEARSEPLVGQVAVANVVMNRVRDERFPNTVCKVVKQRKSKTKCQFSWYCDGKSDKAHNKQAYKIAVTLAEHVINGKELEDYTDGALFYHADYVVPYWTKHFDKTKKIGTHIFYK
jgi:N-acetylmuramoyl-L-alanine amidase